MSKRYVEGTLSSLVLSGDEPPTDVDFDALAVIADVEDFLTKVDRLANELRPPPGSLREQEIANITHWISHVRQFMMQPESQSVLARRALLYLMHASMCYVEVLKEYADDQPSKKANSKGLTREKYLQFRATARTRKELASLCKMSPQALQKWEDENNMPRPRRR